MVALYYQHALHLLALSRAPLSALRIARFQEWRLFLASTTDAACAVLMIDCLRSHQELAALQERTAAAACPTLLVTRPDPENVRLAVSTPLEEVIWFDEVETALLPAITRARGAAPLERVARRFAASAIPPRLRGALVEAARGAAPVRTVAQLA
ncbi:MAG TPA: hypothetical protein VF771_16220, partial [Longimicrobiaceae bacterium]